MSAVQVTVDSQELALVTQQANPILLLDQDQVRDYTIVNYITLLLVFSLDLELLCNILQIVFFSLH